MLLIAFLMVCGEVLLQNRGAYIDISTFAINSKVLDDGSFVLWETTSFFHFSNNGELLFHTGKKGKAPGEFEYIDSVVKVGNFFVASDLGRNEISVFDEKGSYLRRSKIAFYNLEAIEDGIYGNDRFMVRKARELGRDSPVKIVGMMKLNNDLKAYVSGGGFIEPDPICYDWSFLSCFYYVEKIRDKYYVSGYLTDKLRVVNASDLQIEREVKFGIDNYIPPPVVEAKRLSTVSGINGVMKTFTQIFNMDVDRGEIILEYIVPGDLGTRFLQRFDTEGSAIGSRVEIFGNFMGMYQGKGMVLVQRKLEDGDYEQKVYSVEI